MTPPSQSRARVESHVSRNAPSTSRHPQSAFAPEPPEPHFSVFIRCPFPREGFVDPPLVEWNATKEKALWKILSQASGGNVLDWQELADRFEVSLHFLLQQSAWLYEHQLSQVRAQMRKVANPNAAAASPSPSLRPHSRSGATSAAAVGSQSMRRTGSGGGSTGATTSTLRPRESPIPEQRGVMGGDGSSPTKPGRSSAPPMSRTSSTSTTMPTRQRPSQPQPHLSPKPRRANPVPCRPSHGPSHPLSLRPPPVNEEDHPPPASSSSSSADERPSMLKSQALRRPSNHAQHPSRRRSSAAQRPGGAPYLHASDSDSEENDEPAFLPFSTTPTQATSSSAGARPSSARRSLPQQSSRRTSAPTGTPSSSSAATQSSRPPPPRGAHLHPPGSALSPRRKDGSEGTATGKSSSMGSSFSDLDDASVTQSALEEALMSGAGTGSTLSGAEGTGTDGSGNAQGQAQGQGAAAGVARRMSNLSQALKSKYL